MENIELIARAGSRRRVLRGARLEARRQIFTKREHYGVMFEATVKHVMKR